MSLDTQQFGIKRYWLSAAFEHLPGRPDIFAAKSLNEARKAFLAGNNQVKAIKNWLNCADVIESTKGSAKLTECGELMAAQDPRAQKAWTWWLFHLHLCINQESFPYSSFFLHYEAEGKWMTVQEIVDHLSKIAIEAGKTVEKGTVDTYFSGIEHTFRPGGYLNELALVEERSPDDGEGKRRLRRRLARAADIAVAYAVTLFQKIFFPNETTVEARQLLSSGLARALGMKDTDVREALGRISQHAELSGFVQYRKQVNQDSVQFIRFGEQSLRAIRTSAYKNQDVKWQ